MNSVRAFSVVAAAVTLAWAAVRCPAAVLTPGTNTSLSVNGTSGLGGDFDLYNESIEYTPGALPQTLTVSRSGEATSGGQVVARMSSTATQTSSVVLEPLELRAAVDAAFTSHVERLANYPSGGGAASVGGASNFEQIVEVTDGPAIYSFSGRLIDSAMVRVLKSTPGGVEELHLERGAPKDPNGQVFNFRGTIDPGRYSFLVNASGGGAATFAATMDTAGGVRNVSLRVSQVPEPGSVLAVAGLAGVLAGGRRRCCKFCRQHGHF